VFVFFCASAWWFTIVLIKIQRQDAANSVERLVPPVPEPQNGQRVPQTELD
jgi:hypothetical protein